MNPNSLSLEEVLSEEAITALRNEMTLVYWRLNDMNVYEKAGARFDEGDWGLCMAVFSLGYINGFIQRRLDPSETPLQKSIYELAEAKYFRACWGDEASNVHHLCWTRISEQDEFQMFYRMGQVASGNEGGIVKDVAFMFMTKYGLLDED
jgi:hypothetical protein